jgi:hypothetical protein
MRIVGVYSFNRGKEVMEADHPEELSEIYRAFESVNAEIHKTKKSKEKTKRYRMLYNPRALNIAPSA